MAAMAGFGAAKPKREPIEVKEPKPFDKSLDKLLGVRKQRLGKLERDRKDTLEAWKAMRARLREAKLAWRASLQASKDYWIQARKEFLTMNTTSGQYQRSKAVYERMKQDSADMRMACLEMLKRCKTARSAFFEAREKVVAANRQQEKLTIMRDELRTLHEQQQNGD